MNDVAPVPIVSKLTPEEKKQFDNALKSMLAHLDSHPLLSTQLCVLKAHVAQDNIFEFRVVRYPTAAEWRLAIQFIEHIARTDLNKTSGPRPSSKPERKRK